MTRAVVLRQLTVTGRRPGPRLLIVAGVHGDEFEGMAAIRRLAHRVKPALLRGRLTLVPVVNEDAYVRRHRCASDGLDLARTCPGRATGSITRRVAFALSRLIRQADYFIDLHTGGTTYTILPTTGYMLHPRKEILDAQRRMARAFALPIVWGTDWRLEGRSLSVARDANIPAIYAEHGGGGRLSAAGVDDYTQGCLNVMAAIGMIDKRNFRGRVRLVVEDPRPSSGHLQVNNPAPCSGFFEPTVTLGQRVRKGDVLGSVCDVLGRRRRVVRSNKTGMVLVLKTFARVDQGEGLVVVLETGRGGR